MAKISGVRITLAPDIENQAKTASFDRRVEIANAAEVEIRGDAVVDTGSFRDHLGVVAEGHQVAVVDTDEGAEWIEYGNHWEPAHATMVEVMSGYGKYSGVKPRSSGRPGRQRRKR